MSKQNKEELINSDLHLDENGVLIGDRVNHTGVMLSYGEMFRIVHEFLNEFYKHDMIINTGEKVRFKSFKEGDGSPFPIEVFKQGTGKNYYQLKPEEVIGLDKDWEK